MMKILIYGKLSTKQTSFAPFAMWFASEDCTDYTKVSENCICLSAIDGETKVTESGFFCKWTGVDLEYGYKSGSSDRIRNPSVKCVKDLIKSRNMRLVRIEANFDSDVDVTITNLEMYHCDEGSLIDTNIINTIRLVKGRIL